MNKGGAAALPSYDRAAVPTVLFLGASVSQLAAIAQARAAGWRVLAVDADPHAVGFAEADVSEAIDFTDVERVVEVARDHRIDAVVAISTDRAVPVAAAVADRLGLPGVGAEAAHVMTDKAAMRTRLNEHGIPQPAFAVLNREVEPSWELDAVGIPAVLKPADSGGQRGLFHISGQAELTERLPQTLAHSRSGRAMLERFIDGHELNGIVVARDGNPTLLTLSDRLRPPGIGFGVGWIHLYPSSLAPTQLESARKVAVDAVRALGLRDGIAFPQLLATAEGEVFVVEVAARIPAGQMADLVRLGTGVDLVEIALAQALGQTVGDAMVEPRFHRPLAIRFLTASPGILPVGRVVSVDGLERVRAAPGVLEAGLYIQIGETIRPVHVDADRRGYVIATADTADAALDLAQRATRKLEVKVE
jgi:biotin carboxylase